jgi:hypothetical protein
MIARLWGPLPASRGNLPEGYRRQMTLLLVAAFAIRCGFWWLVPGIHQADEVYQVAEQATRALRGFGIVSWEFQFSARPAILAASVVPIYVLNLPVAALQLLAAALYSAFSLLPVWVAFHWAGRLFGLRAGMLAGIIMATWFELVYFAPRVTADAVAAYLLIWSVYLGRPGSRPLGVFAAGFALALTLGIRMQIAPAVGLIALLFAGLHGRERGLPLAGGMAAGLALVGTVEWLWWGIPFLGHWRYLMFEFTHDVSDAFGRQPATFFAKYAVLFYGGTLPIIAALSLWGGRIAPIVLVTAVAIALPFHFIGHKEYRFMMSAVPFMVLLMGISAGDILARVRPAAASRVMLLVTSGWLVAMFAMSWSDSYRPILFRHRNHVLAFREIGQQPDACGVALVGLGWGQTPGYSGLGRDIPIYEAGWLKPAARLYPAANYVITAPKTEPLPQPYAVWRTYSRPVETIYRRPGGCVLDRSEQIRLPPAPPGVRSGAY